MTERRRTRCRQPPRLPGDPTPEQRVARILRVDHAGEYGAKRIYEGQLAVLGETSAGPVIRDMAEGERRHLASFAEDLAHREVRPTVLLPLWHVAGFAMGAATAL
ncbi:MAG: demethoxyubiquinone hydroxylase family protein, partial [Alphaproteobacteria bacterium]|nr:demethoxyubiquinone hydroxylase family protein [Alphaproteobacteria bacterium]